MKPSIGISELQVSKHHTDAAVFRYLFSGCSIDVVSYYEAGKVRGVHDDSDIDFAKNDNREELPYCLTFVTPNRIGLSEYQEGIEKMLRSNYAVAFQESIVQFIKCYRQGADVFLPKDYPVEKCFECIGIKVGRTEKEGVLVSILADWDKNFLCGHVCYRSNDDISLVSDDYYKRVDKAWDYGQPD